MAPPGGAPPRASPSSALYFLLPFLGGGAELAMFIIRLSSFSSSCGTRRTWWLWVGWGGWGEWGKWQDELARQDALEIEVGHPPRGVTTTPLYANPPLPTWIVCVDAERQIGCRPDCTIATWSPPEMYLRYSAVQVRYNQGGGGS